MNVAIGSPAPDFTLPGSSGRDVTLSGFRGASSVLLAFYPEAFTEVCTDEMCRFSEGLGSFRSHDTVVLGVSVDPVDVLREFVGAHDLGLELLSDEGGEVCRSYGTYSDAYRKSGRAYVIIDRDGLVRWWFMEDTPATRRDNRELLEQLEAVA